MKLYDVNLNCNDCLLVIDMQKDFMEDGALPVPGTDQEFINAVEGYTYHFEEKGCRIFLTQDWHDSKHSSFVENGGPWPIHCVEGTDGIRLSIRTLIVNSKKIFKGMVNDVPGYSVFEDNRNLRLFDEYERIFVCGVALDYCVKETVRDIITFLPRKEVFLLLDGTRAVKDFEVTIREMVRWGVNLISL